MLLNKNIKNTPQLIDLIFTLAVSFLKIRYKNSLLGILWSLLNPIFYFTIFTLVFRNAFPDIENYSLYLLSGLIFWTFFSSSSNQILMSIINYRGVLKSINVPAIVFPLAILVSTLLNLLITMIPFTVMMIMFGLQFTWAFVLLVPILFFFSVFTFGISLFMCSLNVYFRDIQQFWETLLPLIFYTTPIFYSSRLVPEAYSWLLYFNPLYHYITIIREVLYHGSWPEPWLILSNIGIAIVSLFFGLYTYKKLEKGFISNY